MTLFIVVALVMVAIAMTAIIWPLLRAPARPDIQRRTANAAVFRDQFADLESDLARGVLSSEQYGEAKAELERRVLDEVKLPTAAVSTTPHRAAALLIGLAIPIVAGLLYWRLGTPAALSATPVEASAPPMTQEQVDAMVTQLAQRLQNEPNNVEGWTILARSYYVLGRFPEAVAAYEKLNTLVPDDADLLADYADALAMSRDRNVNGLPLQLVERALRINPGQWKALAMAGTAAFDRKDYAKAITYWERLKVGQAPDSPMVRQIQASIDEARNRGGLAQGPAKGAQPLVSDDKAAVAGTVDLSPALKGKVQPSDTVFVFARPVGGARMPLAIVRAQVKDLPLKFRLDDSLAMSPAAKISSQSEVVITARVSRSGNAAPQAGDLEGAIDAVKVGASNVKVTIDRAVP